MQIERKPSRWPYVGMLIGLLVACLLAPSYWHSAEAPEQSLGGPASDLPRRVAYLPGSAAKLGTSPTNSVTKEVPYLLPGGPALDWIAATGLIPNVERWPAATGRGGFAVAPSPTIDDLISSLDGNSRLPAAEARQFSSDGSGEFTLWSPMAVGSPALSADPNALAAIPGPRVTAALRWVGGMAADYSPIVIGRWLGQAVSRYWLQFAEGPTGIGPEIGPLAPNFPDDFPASEFPAADFDKLSPGKADSPRDASSGPISASPWSVPDALFVQLARLTQDPYSAYWAQETISHLQALLQVDRHQGDEAAAVLAALSHSAEVANQLAEQAGDDRMRVELLRAHWALARRLDCWKVMNDIRVAAVTQARVAARGSLDSLLHGVAQRNDLESLSSQLEAYERMRDPALAYRVAQAQENLAASPDPLDHALADAVEQHYRNANVRVAITSTMLNRFVPEAENESQPVWDRIAGTPVRGQSETSTTNRLRLEPATGRWQMNLESSGVVESNTLANGGRARLRSYGATDFTVRKSVVVESNGGVRMQPSVASANNYNHLAGVTTDFDWVPLFGSYARSRAVDQYRAKRPQAKAEIECKVTARVGDRLDEEAAEAVDRVEREVHQRVTDPLAAAGVELTTIELTTTSERVVGRFRVAGAAQLGGHTPRPRALSDSLVSVQVHESALTNGAVSLGLDGERLSAPQLQARLREKLPDLTSATPPEAREDTTFQFADRGAVQFRIDGGRFEIAVLVADFVQERQHIRNFIVHAYYVPVVNGMSAELVRDGALGIEGRISATERARLYSVFNEVLGAERHLPVVRLNDPADSRLAGLMITQFVLEDGWLGLAVGPDAGGRVAERSRSLR